VTVWVTGQPGETKKKNNKGDWSKASALGTRRKNGFKKTDFCPSKRSWKGSQAMEKEETKNTNPKEKNRYEE